jgi:toxin ParE1/3/4
VRADLRALAVDDIAAAVDFYRSEAGASVTVDFVDALEAAIDHLRRHPLTGSLRFAYELEVPDLRSWPCGTFPHLIFYLPNDDRIDIWRVLHSRRDIPAHLISDPPP